MVLRLGKGALYLIYALYHQAACTSSTSFSRDFAVWHVSCVEVLLKMQCGDVLYGKRVRVLSRNEIREIVMDPDSNEDKYYASQESDDEEEPCPPSWRSSISQPPSPDNSASSSEDQDDAGNVAGQQPQPSQWTLPPKSQRCVAHTFIGAPNGGLWDTGTGWAWATTIHVCSETSPSFY